MPVLGLRVDPETGMGVVEIEGTAVVLEEEERPLILGEEDGPAVLVQGRVLLSWCRMAMLLK